MPENNQPQQQNNSQDDPNKAAGTQGGDSNSQGSQPGGATGTKPAFDDETNAARGQAGEGGLPQEGAWRPSDDDETSSATDTGTNN